MGEQVGTLIAKIHQITGRIFSKKLKEYNIEEINPAQGRILHALSQNEGISIHELAIMTSLGCSTLTSMLDRLEQSGYLIRIPSKEDRRKMLLQTTEKSKRGKEGYDRVASEIREVFFQGFQKEEIEQFEIHLKKVFQNLLELEGES